MNWKVLLIGAVVTAVFAVAAAVSVSELTQFGLSNFLSTGIGPDFPGRTTESRVREYFAQPQIVLLHVSLIALAFGVAGYITGRISKSRAILQATLAALPVAILFLSIWSPLFVAMSAIGGVVAKRAINKSN